jgi:transglutaminase-like putative cysteine protease
MKKLILTAAVLYFLQSILTGQDFSREFGKVGQEEIDLKNYSRDPSAEAVILFDMGDSRFIDTQDDNYNIEFTRTKRIKIFTKAALKYAEVAIPFYIDEYGKAETVKSIEAYSYNWENGQLNRSVLDPSTVYVEKINDRWSQKKFVIPNTRPGSVIEYKFVLESPFQFNLPSWKFQDYIPTIYSKYVVRMVPFYVYEFIMQGTNRFDYQTSVKDPIERIWGTLTRDLAGQDVGYGVRFHDLINTYVLKDVPAFRDEAYITSDDDYLVKLDFQESKIIPPVGSPIEIISTWPKLTQELIKNDHFGKFVKAADKPATKILETKLNLSGKTQTEKCRDIINYVKSGFKWNSYSSIYCSKSQHEFMDQKKGNSADINLFLVALLRAAGINASPVILSTREHGKIRTDYPFLHYFNYVVVLVNSGDQQFLCDGTDFYTNYNRIPSRCINEKGLVIQEGDLKWISLNTGYNSVDNKSVTMDISPESLKATFKMGMQAIESDACWYKDTFSDDTAKLKEYFSEKGIQTVNKIATTNFDNNELPYTVYCEGETEIEQLNDKLIVSPYLGFYPKKNKLTQPSRTYPIDFTYANTESYNCAINIPHGYKVLTMPESYNIDNEIAKIKVNYALNGSVINIGSEFGFKKAVYPPSDYSSIKNYFDIITKKFNEQIVLVKEQGQL